MSKIRPSYPIAMAGVVLGMGGLSALTLWSLVGGPMWGLDVVVAAVSLVAALAQLWWPASGALAATLLATISPVATAAATMGALQVAQRRRFPVAAAVAAGGIAAHVVQGLWRPNSGISQQWWLIICSVG
ncbi:hypothetical protein E1286_13900 [Nonomuraea terrae]|uniref:Uncharacterized protein n=1 Tax=Nonomuraea terrae TaxID=2530383 RepID=A0A4R4YZZ2_9ACTN|nr:hypothetical protein [Nonomuraea terrae]TDD49322.1 hypothetical protein E1286_13900 [Nonomuraea terrae]